MEVFMGQIAGFGYWTDRDIYNWMICDGRTLSISDYSALFSLLGTKYGGDGTSTFAIPDLREASTADNVQYQICVVGMYPSFQ